MKEILLFLLSFFLLFSSFVKAEYISNCSILDQGTTYYLTQDITNASLYTCIDITANNVVLDCQNHLIHGVGSGIGIRLVRRNVQLTYVTIKNCVVSNWSWGIYAEYIK